MSADAVDPGLCGGCRHARLVGGARSVFWSCARSLTDAAYPRYPRLPVIRCAGFEPSAGEAPADGGDQTAPAASS